MANLGSHTEFVQHADNIKARPLLQPLKIGVDLMGNEQDPQAILKELQSLPLPEGVQVIAIGAPQFESAVKKPLTFVKAEEFVSMDENPLSALRKKKRASIPVGLRMLKSGKLDAFVSAGNTGALVSSSKMILSTFKGFVRPALLTLMPTKREPVAVLDVGANLKATKTHFVQFAKLGAAFQRVRGIKDPKVGLLNIGEEALKGTGERREAFHLLKKSNSISFTGNIEGKSVFNGDVDVIVTDGFTGNIFLKTAEGIASLILDKIESSSKIKEFKLLHYSEYPGAILIGVNGIVIKCHGYSTLKSFTKAVFGAIDFARERYVQKILDQLR